jgi:RNA polymerase sigma-70 factor (ECF subfamily)
VTTPPGTITLLLGEAREGRPSALDDLFELLYDDLRAIARRELRAVRNSPLHATTIVHAACERLLANESLDAQDRRHFYFVLGRAMHDVLIEQIREEQTLKRGGGWKRRPLVEFEVADQPVVADALDLSNALASLEQIDAEAHKIVVLRFYGGRTLKEAAELMGCTFAVARGHWEYAKAWLHNRLSSDTRSDDPQRK